MEGVWGGTSFCRALIVWLWPKCAAPAMLQFRCVSLGRPTPQNTLQAIVSLQVLSTQGGEGGGGGLLGRSGVCGVALVGLGELT